MSIKEMLEKIKPFYPLLLVLVVASLFFVIGRLSALESQKTPIKIEYSTVVSNSTSTASVINTVQKSVVEENSSIQAGGEVIGSKSGKKYYFPWCGTVKRILPQNQVHFASIDEARKAGFTPGGNCKGLK